MVKREEKEKKKSFEGKREKKGKKNVFKVRGWGNRVGSTIGSVSKTQNRVSEIRDGRQAV